MEIVVVDDGSPAPVGGLSDGPHPLRLLRQQNAGPAAARNAAAAVARGDLLLFTDDDCRPRSGWAAAFAKAAAVATVPTLFAGVTINALDDDIFARTSQAMNDYLTAQDGDGAPFFASNNIAMPRAHFAGIGGFDTGYRRAAGEDRALCRTWAAAGHAFAPVAGAVLDHHHALSLRRFWRQHRNYGYGAARFHATATGTAPFRPARRPGFYAGLVLSPMRGGLTPRGIAMAGLVALSQVATAQGYREARREE